MRLALVFWGLGESWASDAGVARLMVRWVDLGVLDPAGGP